MMKILQLISEILDENDDYETDLESIEDDINQNQNYIQENYESGEIDEFGWQGENNTDFKVECKFL